MEILFQSYTAYSRYIERYDWLTSQEALAVVQSHPPSPPPPATPPHLLREKKMRLREREMLHVPWSMRGWGQEIPWERGWFRAWWLWRHVLRCNAAWETTILYQFEFLFLHCRSGADSVVCSLFGVLYFRLEIYLSVSGFGFSILLVCFFF